MTEKTNILVVGFGGIGTITAYNLEASGLVEVTGVLRSNYQTVHERGFKIWSCDHGEIEGWKPTKILSAVPNMSNGVKPFDYVIVTTKNIPDISPTVVDVIRPAITPGITVVVLIQNGLNIEHPVIKQFPQNIVISGISRTNSSELKYGEIFHQDHDLLLIGPFRNVNLQTSDELLAAQKFVNLYNAAGKATCTLEEDVAFIRWRKLVYNASFNSLCTITGMDTSQLRLAEFPVEDLLRPVMLEIMAIAKAAGVKLDPHQDEISLGADSLYGYFRPSMQQDIDKGNYIEMEIIVGAPMREAERLGVPAPNLKFVYSLLKALQMRTKYQKGHAKLPARKN